MTPARSEPDMRGSTVARREPVPDAPRHRAARLVLVTGVLASGIVVVGLAIALSGGTRPRRGATSSAVAHAVNPAVLTHDVGRLNAIVQLFIAGKRLSHVQHDYIAAEHNRVRVLERLMAFHATPQLQPAKDTLAEMSASALSYNLLMARGETDLARAPDNVHNALRSRFVAEFNPLARRYLRHSYSINDL